MRLPQSSGQSLSFRLIPFIFFITLVTMLPLDSPAATQQLICAPTSLRFGTVTVSQSETQLAALINSGQTSVTVSAMNVSGSEFSVSGLQLPVTLAPGASATLKVTFAPTATGWIDGKVVFTSNASNASLQFGFAGTGVSSEPLTAEPSSLSFGQAAVGTSATLSVVLTNARAWKETLKGFQTVGSNFSVSGPALPLTLSAGQSVTLSVTFAPQAAGVSGGSLFISGPALNIPLTGTGTLTTTGQLTISPATLSFGNVIVGDTGTQTAVLTAAGGSITISSAASNNSQFVLSGATFPLTLAAGQNAQVNVAFTPQAAGAVSGKVSFSSNANNPQSTEVVAGTGTAPQVSLGWSPSTSQVTGYNVYRGTSPGSYSKINSGLDPNTTYIDTTVSPGMTYYYAATAVNSSGVESSFSAPVEVAVP